MIALCVRGHSDWSLLGLSFCFFALRVTWPKEKQLNLPFLIQDAKMLMLPRIPRAKIGLGESVIRMGFSSMRTGMDETGISRPQYEEGPSDRRD
jgi:hypothetical protein